MSDPGQEDKPMPPIGDEPMYQWFEVQRSDEAHTQIMRVPGGYLYAVTRHGAGAIPPLAAVVYVPFGDVETDPWVSLVGVDDELPP